MPFARSGRATIHWRAEGAGEPLLMVMGLNASHRSWYRLTPHLRGHVRPIVFDNRGTGRSSAVNGPLTMGHLVEDALAVLDAAGVARAHVLGTSMGGMVAQHLALEHRDRVASLVLASTTPVGRGRTLPWRMAVAAAPKRWLSPERAAEVMAPMLYAPRTRVLAPERMAEDLAVRLAEPTPPATAYAQLAAVARHDTRARLHELAGLPTTVVHGADDRLVPADRGRLLAGLVPGARLVVLPECGHLMTTDAEEASAAVVLDHVGAASSAPRSSRAA